MIPKFTFAWRLALTFTVFCVLLIGSMSPAYGGNFSVTWDANTEPDLAGYKIYVSKVAGDYSNSPAPIVVLLGPGEAVGDHEITVANDGLPRFSVVTAFDKDGNESGYSNEITFTPTDEVPPAGPKNYKFSGTAFLDTDGRWYVGLRMEPIE